MVSLRYRIAVTLTAGIVASSTVLVSIQKIDAERYAMLVMTVLAYWMPSPAYDKNQENGKND